MPQIKQRRASQHSRPRVHARKVRRKITRRQGSTGPETKAPAVIANSAFALTLKPKSWAHLNDELGTQDDPKEFVLYHDLVRAYNHGAELVGVDKIQYKRSNTSTAAISDLLALFKKNICPPGFEVNIDEHYNKKTKKEGFHFSMFAASEFPSYWHFFEIKHLVKWLRKTNPKLHDLFIVFLRLFIGYCAIPSWFDGPMANAQFILADYVSELQSMLAKEGNEDVNRAIEHAGYTIADMKKRLASIEATMKEYATGDAQVYMQAIIKTKPVKPHYLLRSLKKFPPQHKLVQFMKIACELMKERVAVDNFCYHSVDDDMTEGLPFDQQVTIIWDWNDHYSATYTRSIEDYAHSEGVFAPTLHARIMPFGTGNLNLALLKQGVGWPKRLSALQARFQEITERFTQYKERYLL